MTMKNPLRTLLLTASFGGFALLGGGLSCVITLGPLDCSECGNTGCHSQLVGSECFCDSSFEWASPNDPEDFECDRIPGKGGDASCGGDPNNPVHVEGQLCVCDSGFNWCNPDDLNDLSCCEDENQVPATSSDTDTPMTDDSGTGDTAGTADETADTTGDPPGMCTETETPWNGVEPDAADCNKEGLGLVYCSNNDAEGPEGSRYWECDGTDWVESTTVGDESCQFDGRDFSAGCIDDGESVLFVCGDGPGTPCSGPECDGCGDDGDQILFCEHERLHGDSCNEICTVEGDAEGITYDFGECSMLEDGSAECLCCDEGDEGCPFGA